METIHLFFEQSGIFKNEFKKLGYSACDYDILNDFGETDYVIDLFKEIETAYGGGESVFDKIKQDDLIFAFFPCIRFTEFMIMFLNGTIFNYKNLTDEQKLEKDLELHSEVALFYKIITEMVLVCMRKGLKLIIENPYTTQHYLTRYWALQPKIIDNDRTKRGDYFKKPTQYWFINCEPKNNFVAESYMQQSEKKTIDRTPYGAKRSLISKDYAERFIKEFIL